MPLFHGSRNITIVGGTFVDTHNFVDRRSNPGSVLQSQTNTEYNAKEREKGHTSVKPGTREHIINRIWKWVKNDGRHPIRRSPSVSPGLTSWTIGMETSDGSGVGSGASSAVADTTSRSSEIASSVPGKSSSISEISGKEDRRSRLSNALRLRLRYEFEVQDKWHEIQQETSDGKWAGGSYCATFVADPSGSTTIRADIKGLCVSWSIEAPTSLWYPGTHSGSLCLPADYPFKPPRLRFLTVLFSPAVRFDGKTCSEMLFDMWRPQYTILDILSTTAVLIMLDPFGRLSHHPLLPGLPLYHDDHQNYELRNFEYDSEAFVSIANFFSRAYVQANIERMSNPEITSHEREISVHAIQNILSHYEDPLVLGTAPPGSCSNDPVEAFARVSSMEEWIAEERRWADALSLRYRFRFANCQHSHTALSYSSYYSDSAADWYPLA